MFCELAIDVDWLKQSLRLNASGIVAKRASLPKVEGTIAILPIHGMISQRASIWQEIFGGTATQSLTAAYTRAVNDERIKGIVLDIDSPGGTTAGVQEAADIIHEGAQIKPTVAISNSLAASAAYWLGSQVGSGRFMAAPGSSTGSIGVYMMHEDISTMLSNAGVNIEFIATPEHKVEGNPYQPLDDEARQHYKEQVQQTYEQFVGSVARGRGVTTKQVKDQFGKGRTFHEKDAAAAGMVDGVATLTGMLQKMGGGKAHGSQATIVAELEECWKFGIPVAMHHPTSREMREREFRLRKLGLTTSEAVS